MQRIVGVRGRSIRADPPPARRARGVLRQPLSGQQSGMEDARSLGRRAHRLRRLGSIFLLVGGVGALIGGVLMIAFDGFPEAAGVMLASLASAPTVVGLALWLAGVTGWHASHERPFA
jgi:hypothetical protein